MASRVTKRRVLVLMHEEVVPPSSFEGMTDEEINSVRTEDDVIVGLEDLGHQVHQLGIGNDLGPLRTALEEVRPHVVFNLLEDFGGQVLHDFNVVAYLELAGVAYTGCSARGLLIARDKALSKKILHYHRIRAPRFATFRRGRAIRRSRQLTFPVIVKSLIHEASLGIAQASVVYDHDALVERVRFIHERYASDVIAEQYIPGRELYSAVLGNQRLEVFPAWELVLDGLPEDAHRIASRKAKWDQAYQDKYGIRAMRARNLGEDVERRIAASSKKICRRLDLDGYVRLDYRLADDGALYFLEANPNPEIANGEAFAEAAAAAGLSYEQLLQRIVSLAIRRRTRSGM